jgi:hypothetical protein
MFETSKERENLLRTGLTCKTIEKLDIESNDFKLVRFPIILDLAG